MRSASTPCQLRVTSFASKSRLVDRHPLYVPASAAPHVRASHYGLRLAHCSEQYDHGPKITTADWQTRSAGDEEVTNLEARGFDGWDHRRRRALVCVNGGRKLTPLELTRRHGVFRRRRQFAVVSLNDPRSGTARSSQRQRAGMICSRCSHVFLQPSRAFSSASRVMRLTPC